MLRRRTPRLEQNLNTAGLAFLCAASCAFLTSSALRTPHVPDATQATVRDAETLVHGDAAGREDDADRTATDEVSDEPAAGPATSVVAASVAPLDADVQMKARIASVLSHLAVVVGLWFIGWFHFKDGNLGVAMATLYLLLPPTSYHVVQLNHVLPAALIVWTYASARRPIVAGILLGLACGMQAFALFLLPLWFTWYGRRGSLRFGLAWGGTVAAVVTVAVVTRNIDAFEDVVKTTVDWPHLVGSAGFWGIRHAAYRVTAFVGFLVMLAALTLWPLQKNFEQLMTRGTAVIVGTLFWYPAESGGWYVLWYLPLLLLTAFRPNLERVTFESLEEAMHADDDDEIVDEPAVVPMTVDSGRPISSTPSIFPPLRPTRLPSTRIRPWEAKWIRSSRVSSRLP